MTCSMLIGMLNSTYSLSFCLTMYVSSSVYV